MSTLGGGPGNLDFAKFADQVPAKPPGSISAALTVSDTAMREKAKIVSRIFMADMIIQMERCQHFSSKNGASKSSRAGNIGAILGGRDQ